MAGLLINILSIVNLAIYLLIIVKSIRKVRISKAHLRFFLLILFGFLWVLNSHIEGINEKVYQFSIHLDFALAAIVSGFAASFAIHFPRKNEHFTLNKELIFFVPLVTLAALSFGTSIINPLGFRMRTSTAGYFPYISILFVYFIVIAGGSFVKKYWRAEGTIRLQLRYILIGYFTTISTLLAYSVYNDAVSNLPVLVDRLAFNLSAVFSFLTAYAMLRYRFLDVKLALRRGMVHTIVFGLIIAVLTLLVWGVWQYTKPSSNSQFTYIAAFIILIGFIFEPIRRVVIRWTNRVFFAKEFERRRAARSFRDMSAVSLEAFEHRVINSVSKYLEGANAQLLIRSNHHWTAPSGLEVDMGFSPSELLDTEPERNVFVRDEIDFLLEEGRGQSDSLKALQVALDQTHFSIIVPIRGSAEQIIGAILIGPKKSKDAFTVEDVEFLRSLGRGASMVMENMRMYQGLLQQLKLARR